MISRKFGQLQEMSFGPFSMIYKIVKGLSEKIQISVLSSHLGLPKVENVDGIDVYRIFFPPVDDLTKLFFTPHAIFDNGLVEKISPHILHSQDIEGGMIFKKHKEGKIKKIFSVKSAVSFRTKNRSPQYGFKQKFYNRTLDFWEKLIVSNSDYFITPSNFLQNEIMEHYNLDESKFFRIKNATFTDLFKPGIDVSKLKNKLGLHNETVLFSTSAGWRKGFDALLKSFNIIKKKFPNTKLIVAGTTQFGIFEKFIDKKVVDIDKDIFLVGRVSNYELPQFYNLAKLYLFPSFLETQPNTLIEALSCGRPVVTFDSGGTPELVSEKEGILVETGNVEKFSESTLKILEDEKRIKKLSTNCRKRALKEYKIERAVDEHIKMYEQVLE